jgi:hypothetical protein
MAESKLGAPVPGGRPKAYGRWLRSKSLPAVIGDVCRPIVGQFPITLRYVAEQIGDVRGPEEMVRVLRTVWRTWADEVIPGSVTKSLETRLSITLLEERIPRWEAKAMQAQPTTATGDGELDGGRESNHRQEAGPAQGIAEQASTTTCKQDRVSNPDKRNIALLRGTDDQFKRAVTVDVARRFGGVSKRAIEKAVRKGALKSEGAGPNRRIIVQSLLDYFPPENSANRREPERTDTNSETYTRARSPCFDESTRSCR